MGAGVKCKRVMRLVLRRQDFAALNVTMPVFLQLPRIGPDQECQLHDRVRRASGHVHVNSPLRE